MVKFPQRLKELRLEKSLSKEKLATELQTNRFSISDWEQGRTETDFSTLIKIADYFDVTLDYLLGRKDY